MNAKQDNVNGEQPTTRKSRRRYLFVLGLLVYSGVVWYFGWRDIRDELLGARIDLVVIAVLLIVSATWLRVLKWRYALGPDAHATGLFFMSKATGAFTPGRLGEFAPMVIRDHRTPKVGAWIMYDRVVEILVTITIGLYGLAIINFLTRAQFIRVTAIAVVCCGLGIYFLTHRRLFLWAANKTKEGSLAHRTTMLFAAVSEELFQFTRYAPGIVLITVVTKVMDLVAVMLMFQALSVFPGFGLVAASKCALAIVSFLPLTPTATGAPHATQAWLMNQAAEIPPDALVVGIGIEVAVVSITFWTSFGLASRLIGNAAWTGK
ncbi:MAG: lysylphosphatidylglycerol synthase domain-containing protein [Candidatus Hydrogenedentota bacterium]